MRRSASRTSRARPPATPSAWRSRKCSTGCTGIARRRPASCRSATRRCSTRSCSAVSSCHDTEKEEKPKEVMRLLTARSEPLACGEQRQQHGIAQELGAASSPPRRRGGEQARASRRARQARVPLSAGRRAAAGHGKRLLNSRKVSPARSTAAPRVTLAPCSTSGCRRCWSSACWRSWSSARRSSPSWAAWSVARCASSAAPATSSARPSRRTCTSTIPIRRPVPDVPTPTEPPDATPVAALGAGADQPPRRPSAAAADAGARRAVRGPAGLAHLPSPRVRVGRAHPGDRARLLQARRRGPRAGLTARVRSASPGSRPDSQLLSSSSIIRPCFARHHYSLDGSTLVE